MSLCHDRVSMTEPELRMTAHPADMTETPDPGGLDAALDGLHLDGALFLRAEYTEAWGYESLDGPSTAGIVRPGSERVILFHLVGNGCCWVALDDGERHWAGAGTSSCSRTAITTRWAAPMTPTWCRSRRSSSHRRGRSCP
jgi:hypothetical protein